MVSRKEESNMQDKEMGILGIGVPSSLILSAVYSGIDYGRGVVNIDLETGIRYGVISVHELPFFYDEAESVYPEFDPLECDELEANEQGEFEEDELERARDRFFEFSEPLSWGIDTAEVSMSHGQDDHDIFVTKSKFFTYAKFCSPCAPGACYLTNQTKGGGVMAYCPSPNMFEEGECPIDIYSVETGKLVKAIDIEEEELEEEKHNG